MAETLTAQLALELGGFTAGLQSAAQAFRQFTSDLTNQIQQLANAFSPLQKAVEDTSKARIQVTKATADATTAIEKQLQRDLEAAQRANIKLQTDLDLERLKVRQQNEKVASEALTSLYRNFFNTSLGLYKENIAQEKALLDTETEQVRATLAAQLRLRREHEAQLATERRLRNNQLRAELTNVRSGATVPGAQPGAAPVGSQAPFQLAQIQGYLNLLDEANSKQSVLAQGLEFLGKAFSLPTTGALLLASAIQGLVRWIRETATESVNAAIKFQSLQAVFNGTSGGARQGGEAFAFVREQASRLGVNFESLAVSYKNFNAASSALNIKTKESREIFLAFANAARALGLSSDQLQHILVAVEQIMSKGKVSAEELRRQLGNSLPGAFAIAARSIGVTTSELDSMLKKGALLSQDFILPFAREVQRTFGSLVPEQTRTAQAAFERFYNEIKFLQVEFGESILSVFKPALDTVNKILEGYRKIREEREKDRPPKLSPVQGENLGKVQDDINVTTELINTLNDKLFRLRQLQEGSKGNLDFDKLADLLPQKVGGNNRFIPDLDLTPLKELIKNQGLSVGIAETEKEVTRLNNSLKQLLITKERLEALQQDTGTPVIGPISFTKEVEAIDKELKTLEESLAIIDRRIKEFDVSGVTTLKDEFGDTTELVKNLEATLTVQREKYKEIEAAAQKITETLQGSKGLQEAVTPEIQKQLEKVRSLLAVEALRIQQLELEIEKQKDIGKALEEGDKQRRAGIEKRQRDIEKAIEDEVREEEKGNKEKLRILKEYADANLDIEKAITLATSKETRSRVDDLKAKLEEEVKFYQDRRVDQEQIDRLIAARTAEIRRVSTEELEQQLKKEQQLLKEQEKPWQELGNRIESILAGTFERIFQGTTNILDGIKDAFIKLLARLAAEAAAAQIIIGIKTVLGVPTTGGGAGGSGSGAGVFTQLLGLVGGGSGASGGAGNAPLSDTQKLTDQLGSLAGSKGASALGEEGLKALGLQGASQQLLATELFSFGGTESASLGAGAFETAAGEGTGTLTTGTTSVTVGTLTSVVSGALTGIAVGYILATLNDLLGITGALGARGSGALAGAGGGALGGAIIGGALGGPAGAGAGAIIGTLVGAIGGYFAASGKAKPKIDIQNVEGGNVRYDEIAGGLTYDRFNITNAPFRDIGRILPNVGNKPHQVTYSNFIAGLSDAANEVFEQVINAFRGFEPQIQKAFVKPLNDIAEQVRQNLEQTKFEGNDLGQDIQNYFSTELPEFIKNLLRPIQEAVEKINPYVQAFNDIIEKAQGRIQEIQAQRAQSSLSIATQQATIRRGELSGPSEELFDRLGTLGTLQGFLAQATNGQDALTLGAAIQEIVTDILQLSDTLRGQVDGLSTALSEQTSALRESGLDTFTLLIRRQEQLAQSLQSLATASGTARLTLIAESQQLVQGIQGITDELAAQKQELLNSLSDQIHDLEEGLFSPAQVFVRRQEELAEAREEFTSASPARRVELIPVIQGLIQDIFTLGRGEDVLGQDPQLVRNTQAELLGILRELEGSTTDIFSVVGAQQVDSELVLQELQGYLGEISTGLQAIPEHLLGVLDQVQASNDAVFGSIVDLLQQQVTLAQEQIDLLINGLQDPGNIDGLLSGAEAILGGINEAIGSTLDDPNATAALQTELLQGQFLSLQDLVQLGNSQVGLLSDIRANLGGGFSGSSDGGEGDSGFARGSNYIPYNMVAFLHQGEAVIPRHQNTGGGGPLNVNITVNGGADGAGAQAVAERVVQYIEQRSGRLQASRIQVRK